MLRCTCVAPRDFTDLLPTAIYSCLTGYISDIPAERILIHPELTRLFHLPSTPPQSGFGSPATDWNSERERELNFESKDSFSSPVPYANPWISIGLSVDIERE